MTAARRVSWGHLQNAWDLGGLPTASGVTRFGQIYRSMSPDDLDDRGWADVAGSGIATVVDLRNDYEVAVVTARPTTIDVIRCAIEDQGDASFMADWGDRLGSPVYYAEVLRRWPELVAAAISSVSDAAGPVLFHCGAGRDRTGMISAIIEELVGVDRDAILADYESGVRAYNHWLLSHESREKPAAPEVLNSRIHTARGELAQFLDEIDVEEYLLAAGVSTDQLSRLRSRLSPG